MAIFIGVCQLRTTQEQISAFEKSIEINQMWNEGWTHEDWFFPSYINLAKSLSLQGIESDQDRKRIINLIKKGIELGAPGFWKKFSAKLKVGSYSRKDLELQLFELAKEGDFDALLEAASLYGSSEKIVEKKRALFFYKFVHQYVMNQQIKNVHLVKLRY